MEYILLNKGYKKTDNPNEYEKNGWIIRLDGDKIEVFNDPDKVPGKYYYNSINNIAIELILLAIDKLDMK